MRLLLLDQTRDCSTHSSPSLAIYAGRLYEEIGINVEALIEAGSYGAHLEATCSSPFGQEGILGIKLSRQDSGLLSLDISEADIRLRRKAQTFLESLHGNAYSEREAQSPIPTTWEGALQVWG